MKNKKSLYILIPAVLFIWGIIFYKIYTRVNQDNDEPNSNTVAVNNKEKTLCKTDDYQLKLNYPDPFLGGLMKRGNLTSSQDKFAKKTAANVNWPEIKVNGYVENALNKKIKIWVTIGNSCCLMAAGDTNNYTRLIKIYHDSVQFEFNGNRKYYKIIK